MPAKVLKDKKVSKTRDGSIREEYRPGRYVPEEWQMREDCLKEWLEQMGF